MTASLESATVLVVEDDPALARLLATALSTHGFDVVPARTLAGALQQCADAPPAAVLLDLGLPDGDGLSLIEKVRTSQFMPILVLSARSQEADKVAALELGADDYITKPFGVPELIARLRVALRRAARSRLRQDAEAEERAGATLSFDAGPLHLDAARHEVQVRGTSVHLTPLEFKMLVLMIQHAGQVVTHRTFLRTLWADTPGAAAHHVRVHMAELRKKIELNAAHPELVLTEPGVGYRLNLAAHG